MSNYCSEGERPWIADFDFIRTSFQPEIPFDFTQFVDSFDDSFTTKVFEFLVKETALRYRNTQAALHQDTRTSLNRHHHHHHFLPYPHEHGLHGQGLPGQSLERERTTRSPASAAGSPFLDTSSSLPRSLLSNQSNSGLNTGLRRSRNTSRESTTANQASSDPGSSGATRRSSRRGDTLERQRAFILRPPPLPGTSMESLSSLEDSTVAQPFMSFADIFGPNQSTQVETDLQRQRSQDLRQQQLRQLYVQEFLARSNRRRRQAQGNSEPSQSDTHANTQPSPQARYQAHDGLLISSTQPSIADRVQEFRDSAQRARAAMRNLNSDLVIEEDAQVLLTGEVSRRRRRPFIGTTEATGTATQTTGTSGTTAELVLESNLEGVAEASSMVETSLQAQGQGASRSEALEQGLASSNGEAPGQGSDPASSSSQAQDHIVQPIPPTPPSPNPNRNPRPTFQDRRRSSINPADIEAVVRQLEATTSSSSSSSRPFESRLNQILESDQVDQTHISTPPPIIQAPLPSPPPADQDVDNSPR